MYSSNMSSITVCCMFHWQREALSWTMMRRLGNAKTLRCISSSFRSSSNQTTSDVAIAHHVARPRLQEAVPPTEWSLSFMPTGLHFVQSPVTTAISNGLLRRYVTVSPKKRMKASIDIPQMPSRPPVRKALPSLPAQHQRQLPLSNLLPNVPLPPAPMQQQHSAHPLNSPKRLSQRPLHQVSNERKMSAVAP